MIMRGKFGTARSGLHSGRRFNEAAHDHARKAWSAGGIGGGVSCFNEAAHDHARKGWKYPPVESPDNHGFNEAAHDHARKEVRTTSRTAAHDRFNEAAHDHARKGQDLPLLSFVSFVASMRPRMIMRGKARYSCLAGRRDTRFNEAAHDHARKESLSEGAAPSQPASMRPRMIMRGKRMKREAIGHTKMLQ